MSLLSSIGKKHIQLATSWIPSAFMFGSASGLGIVYLTEWKTVLQYLPYYNGKYPKEEPSS